MHLDTFFDQQLVNTFWHLIGGHKMYLHCFTQGGQDFLIKKKGGKSYFASTCLKFLKREKWQKTKRLPKCYNFEIFVDQCQRFVNFYVVKNLKYYFVSILFHRDLRVFFDMVSSLQRKRKNVQFSNMKINEQPQKSEKKKESCGVILRIFRGVSK